MTTKLSTVQVLDLLQATQRSVLDHGLTHPEDLVAHMAGVAEGGAVMLVELRRQGILEWDQ